MSTIFLIIIKFDSNKWFNMIVLQTNAKLIEQAKAEKNQQFFASLLHRYLCSSIGKHNAVKLMPRYIRMLSELEEMAQIMISKRLLY